MFQLNQVLKRYSRRSRETIALKIDSLDIAAGEYVAIVGPSGSGKTTLLSILGGMLSPSEGSVSLNGESLYSLSATQRTALRRENIGFVFQTFNLIPYLTALENVEVPQYLSGVTRTAQRERAVSLLNQLGLGERLQHKPGEMSIGQQQRVALARTLANDPPVILADEPTGNLDPECRRHVLKFFAELSQAGRTIIMVTHDSVAASQAQRQLVLSEGRIATGSPEDTLPAQAA